MDDDTWYNCKLCQERFKTTAELQKHKRVNHRPALVVAKKSAPPPAPVQSEDSNSEVNNDGTGTEQLVCSSCRHQFDTSDPVVLHLLRQNRNENGSLKCPYCVKVLLTKFDLANKKELRTSPLRNLSMRRRSRSTCSSSSNGRSSKVKDRQLPNKGRSRKPLGESTVSLDCPTSPATPVNFKTSSLSKIRKPKCSRSFGAAYRHPEGAGSQGSCATPTRETGHKRSSEVLRTKKYDIEKPIKLPVLINEEPLSNDRLAVPRSREYNKGNITCQYCGFVANSFREVQFHINTHLAKSYPCEFCAAIYRSKQGVLKHTTKHHAEQSKAKQLLEESHDDNSMETNNVKWDSSSMISELSGEDFDQLSNSNMDISMLMHDETSNSVTVPSHFQPQDEENAGTGHGFQEKYFSTDSAQYGDTQSSFIMVDKSLEKVVELANF